MNVSPSRIDRSSASTDACVGRRALVVVGGGPAGLAPLLAAHRVGRLHALLDRGVAIIEQSDALGAGRIGQYAIGSDSTGRTFVDCLHGSQPTPLTALIDHPLALAVAEAGDGPVPLELVGRFMEMVGATLAGMVAAHPGCLVLTGHRVTAVRRQAAGWITTAVDRAGRRVALTSRCVLSATGAHQPRARLGTETVAGVNLLARANGKLMQSGEVLGVGGFAEVERRLAGRADPRVAIVGGSASAAAVAHALLHRLEGISFGPAGVALLHRRKLRVYYPSVAEALADGYTDFNDADICPVSQRVFRFAGFRLDSRDLLMRAYAIGGRPRETRLALHPLQPHDPAALALLDRADLVVAALGYRPIAVPVFDRAGAPIALRAHQAPPAALVDAQCRIVDAEGAAIPGLFGIGLAAGFVPRGALGGEPSFRGQANGLWLWQNDVGLVIVDAVLGARKPARAPVAALPEAWLVAAAQTAPAPAEAAAQP